MAKWTSIAGEWYPRTESVPMKNTFGKEIESEFVISENGEHKVAEGENFIYKGPDREATKMLREIDEDHLGQDFMNHPEFLQSVRNMGYNNPKEYLKIIGYDKKTEDEKQKALASIINKHELPAKSKEIIELAGGKDFSGNKENNVIGGFGDQKLRKPSEAK